MGQLAGKEVVPVPAQPRDGRGTPQINPGFCLAYILKNGFPLNKSSGVKNK